MNRVLSKFNITLANGSTNTLKKSLCKLKDDIKQQDRSGTVYRIDCSDCSQQYIGETGKNTCDRIKEHQSYIRKNYENSLIN